jgi:esterase/lipase
MQQSLTHVYLMPGMAANSTIFENIQLPEAQFEMHLLDWKQPKPKESISDYALRMTQDITQKQVVLIGVSFGGILVQEMSKHIDTKKVIIISSVKNEAELPKRMKIAKRTKAYKLLPTRLINKVDVLAKYSFGERISKRLALYEKYLSIRDKQYLDWSVENIINWKSIDTPKNLIHIHGDKDNVFPVNNIKNYIPIKGGTHIMIINKYKWFNENLPDLILK